MADSAKPDESPSAPAVSAGAQPRPDALVRTLLLAATIASAAITVTLVKYMGSGSPTGVIIPWWTLALGFAWAEVFVFHIEVRKEAITFSLSDLPLILGLFFLPPVTLVLVRTFVAFAVLVLYQRQSPRKLALNLAGFLAEATTAAFVFCSLPLSRDPMRPEAWVATLISIAAAQTVSYAVISLAMRWHGAQVDLRSVLMAIAVTISTNTALACLAAVLVVTNSGALVLLVFVATFVLLAYRSYNGLNRRYSSLQLLYEFTRLVNGSKEPDAIVESMLHEARLLARAQHAVIALGDGARMIVRWSDSDGAELTRPFFDVETLRSFAAGGKALVVARDTDDDRHRALLEVLGAKDCMVAPVLEDDRVVGVLVVLDRNTDVSTFDREDGRLFETLANHAGVALQNGRLIERLHSQAREREHDSLHDVLTGLPNRAHFIRKLTEALSHRSDANRRVGVALLDLDRFKEINDTLGHQSGDLLLRDVGARLRGGLPARVVIARLGGDEFAAVCRLGDDADALRKFGEAIQAALRVPFHVHGLSLEVSASIGLAVSPDDGLEPSTLLQRADVAMYDAKTSNTDRIGIYTAERDTNTPRRLALANDLRAAIDAGDLDLHYQPKARLCDGRVHSAEGLIRWQHHAFGNVPPNEFVPLAERTGMIRPFTQFVIEHGLMTLGQWHAAGLDLGMSLNLSARNLLDDGLPQWVADVLASSRVPASLLTFEVTESSMMDDPAKALETLHALSDLGVRLSIDDFGTGQSSLSYIQRLPVHEVKIDRSFVVPLASTKAARSIVLSIVQLAHSLGLTVVAEGVEDEETLGILTDLGCDDVQGYFLSRPRRIDDFLTWLDQRQPAASRRVASGS